MLTYIYDKQTHLEDRMSSLVLELFWVIGKFPGRPYVAVIDVGGCHDKRKDLVLRKIENGNSTLQNGYVDSASRIHVSDL